MVSSCRSNRESKKVDILLTDIKLTSACIDLNLPFTLQYNVYYSSYIHTKNHPSTKSTSDIYQKGIDVNNLGLLSMDSPQKEIYK